MPRIITLLLLISQFFFIYQAQCQTLNQDPILEGIVSDSVSREPLTGVIIQETTLKLVTETDPDGKFRLTLPPGAHLLKISLMGYASRIIPIQIKNPLHLDILLNPVSQQMEEVVVSAQNNRSQVEAIQSGTFQLNRKELNKLPVLLGETDYFKAIQLMPGIQSSGEGNAAIYVRGGGYDQNLVILDNATVYNPTHLLGFYSVFNSDAIGDVKVIKAGIPAEYGNRLSSVMEFSSRKDIPEKIGIRGNIGLLSSRIGLETPLLNQKAMLAISMRKTYLNPVLETFRKAGWIKPHSVLYRSNYDFYDFNLTSSFQLNPKNKLSLSFYRGKDAFNLKSGSVNLNAGMKWGNQILSLTWHKIFTPFFYAETSVSSSSYQLQMDLTMDQYKLKMNSSILDYQFTHKCTWIISQHKISGGFSSVYHDISPNNSQAKTDSAQLNLGTVFRYYSLESGAFLSDEYEISSKATLYMGLRYNHFTQYGPFTAFQYDQTSAITDTLHYASWQKVKNYQGLDLRTYFRYLLNKNLSLKFSFTSSEQFTHLVNASSITFPTDFWISSSSKVKPQHGLQWSAGIFKWLEKWNLETSLEVYYKTYSNQIEFYKGLMNAVDNTAFDDNLIFGKARSYGAEILLKRSNGPLTGWIGYTFSRTEKSFQDIEAGRWFPAKYDKPVDLSLVLNYSPLGSLSYSLLFVYGTGSSYTPVVGRYFIGGNILNEYGRYNSARMPDYHRCDIAITWQIKKTNRIDSRLICSVYNVYNRHNAFFIYPEVTGNLEHYNLSVHAKEVSIFPVLPSISWEYKF